jgi:hypothetical protein
VADVPRPDNRRAESDSGPWTTSLRTLFGSSEEPEEPDYHATLRIKSTEITAAEVTRRLGEPTNSYEIGYRPGPRSSPSKHAQWYLDSGPRQPSRGSVHLGVDEHLKLHEHVEALLAFAESRRSEIDSLRDACKIDLFCGMFSNDDINCSFDLVPEMSQRLAELALPLYVNVY